jgi:hypothetical protein
MRLIRFSSISRAKRRLLGSLHKQLTLVLPSPSVSFYDKYRGRGGLVTGIVLAVAFLAAEPGAWAAPGDLDPSFDADGRVTTDLGSPD